MKAIEIKGIIPPILTPMHTDESINVEELRRQVDRQIESGVHALFCFGTNGEGYILSAAEKQLVLETVIDQTAGRVPVYAGTGCISTRETIAQSRMARDAGADVLSLITPSFAAASQQELYDHYKAVAGAVDLPIVLYNIPARTGNALAPDTVARLEGTKGRGFAVLSGNDSLILNCLRHGGKGGVAGCANVYPRTMAAIYNCYMAGDEAKAQEYQDSIASFRACFKYGNPNTIVKAAVAMLGYDVGPCRAPFSQIPPEGLAQLKKVLRENEEKGMC